MSAPVCSGVRPFDGKLILQPKALALASGLGMDRDCGDQLRCPLRNVWQAM